MLNSCRHAAQRLSLARRCFASVAGDVSPELVALYRSHPQSFYNIPLEKIEFVVGEHFINKGEAQPHIHIKGADQPGVLHLAPPAPATRFCHFGERGNLGKKLVFLPNAPVISDPWEADQEISVKIVGPQMHEYVAWLQAVQDLYVEHLLANLGSYKKLKKLEGKNPAIVRDMASPVVKFQKDENENKVVGSEFISWKQRIYNKSERAGKIRCELDETMGKDGGSRRHVPLFALDGSEVPLADAHIAGNDIISVQHNLMCGLWGIGSMVGFNIRRNMRSVTMLAAAPRALDGQAAPYNPAPYGKTVL